jgi:hypothetical protein
LLSVLFWQAGNTNLLTDSIRSLFKIMHNFVKAINSSSNGGENYNDTNEVTGKQQTKKIHLEK